MAHRGCLFLVLILCVIKNSSGSEASRWRDWTLNFIAAESYIREA
jgi:hypothetical protein